jgi:hypothetical protein
MVNASRGGRLDNFAPNEKRVAPLPGIGGWGAGPVEGRCKVDDRRRRSVTEQCRERARDRQIDVGPFQAHDIQGRCG